MNKSSSSRSVWSFIIKVIITVATAIGGLIGVQSCI
ncbi:MULTISPECIES: smalltalk protein [Bacteroides]|nr:MULTISPECIES: smalltalk protein [Bacteroides]